MRGWAVDGWHKVRGVLSSEQVNVFGIYAGVSFRRL